jgi:hypothetical protein
VALLGAVVLAGGTAGASGSPTPCKVLTAKQLQRVLDSSFEVLFTDRQTICSWASASAAPAVGVDVTIRKVPKETLASAKQFEQEQEGAQVLKGIGDLAVLSSLTLSPSASTANLTVFEGRDVITISVTDSRSESTPRQMRRLGTAAVARIR